MESKQELHFQGMQPLQPKSCYRLRILMSVAYKDSKSWCELGHSLTLNRDILPSIL